MSENYNESKRVVSKEELSNATGKSTNRDIIDVPRTEQEAELEILQARYDELDKKLRNLINQYPPQPIEHKRYSDVANGYAVSKKSGEKIIGTEFAVKEKGLVASTENLSAIRECVDGLLTLNQQLKQILENNGPRETTEVFYRVHSSRKPSNEHH